MSQTRNRILDDLAKLLTDAAGAAQGLKTEAQSVIRGQAERFLQDMDVVQREEFEAVRAMAAKAREENEALRVRIEALEGALASMKQSG
jgi:BMFP domain-containing protein YqiC